MVIADPDGMLCSRMLVRSLSDRDGLRVGPDPRALLQALTPTQRAQIAIAAAAHPPRAEVEAAAGMIAPLRRQEVADLGRDPAVRVEGSPRLSQTGVAPGPQAAMGLAPAMGHPATHAVRPERHVAAVMAVAVAVVSPAARAMMTEEAAAMTPHLNRNVAAQGICRRVRSIPRAILEGRKKVRPSLFPSCPRRRLTTNHGSRPSRTG